MEGVASEASSLAGQLGLGRLVMRVLDALARHGISIDAIAGELLVDGLARFGASADDLLRVLDQRRAAILRSAKAA